MPVALKFLAWSPDGSGLSALPGTGRPWCLGMKLPVAALLHHVNYLQVAPALFRAASQIT